MESRASPLEEPMGPIINKEIVLESTKAAFLIGSWTRSRERELAGCASETLDEDELGVELQRWSLLEILSHDDISSYDRLPEAEHLVSVLTGLSVALLLSSDEGEYFAIRREWNKVTGWLKVGHGIDLSAPGTTLMDIDGDGPIHSAESLQLIVEYIPELKRGWQSGGSEGVRDYLTVLSLGLKEKRRRRCR
ncbi:MAG: hypothetical protein V1748_07890 [Actinomycetota bacterium]